MNLRHLLSVVLVLAGCFDPAPRNLDSLIKRGDVYLNPDTQSPYSGPVFDVYPNDHLRTSGRLSDGRWDGPVEQYHPNDSIGVRETFEKGNRVGPYEVYYDNGQLRESGVFVLSDGRSVKDGSNNIYFEDGQLDIRVTLDSGVVRGPYEMFYENGLVRERGTSVVGRLVETVQVFGGRSFHRVSFGDRVDERGDDPFGGERVGSYQLFYENGQLQEEGTYLRGRKDGHWRVFFETGDLIEEGSYLDGERCGEWTEGGGFSRSRGFYPANADTSEKAHFEPGGVSWQSEEGSSARSSSVRR